jgi:predicted alpha/beta superfamily hydrolase
LTGDIRIHENFSSRHLERSRRILVYLPPNYERARNWRYPVLYLHDGQNVFDGRTSFIPGEEWEVDESAESLIRSRSIRPLIIVAIYNAGEFRVDEYTHAQNQRGQGGRADAYGHFLLEELMPFIDSRYRTRTEPRNIGIGGSSLGGLVTLYLGMRHLHRFGKLAIMSPSVWWNDRAIMKYIPDCHETVRPRIWLDVGTAEGQRTVDDCRMLRKHLIRSGWHEGSELHYEEAEGAGHTEGAWRARVPQMLRFLFPRYPDPKPGPRRTVPGPTRF